MNLTWGITMINKACILGRIGNKEVKRTKTDNDMTALSIATNRKFIDGQGNQRENTTWHTVYFFNKLAEIANKYTQKGDLIYIKGEINNRKIEDQSGARWVYSINGSELKLLPNGRKGVAEDYDKPKEESKSVDPFDDIDIPF